MPVYTPSEAPSARQLEPRLDRAALLLMLARPARKGAVCVVCYQHPCRCAEPAATFHTMLLDNVLHRMQVTPRRASRERGLRVSQFIGEPAGRFTARLALHAARPTWNGTTDAIPFESIHTRWVSLSDCRFEFGPNWQFQGFAAGQTLPMLVDSEVLLYLNATGTLRGLSGKGAGLTGVFALNGRLTSGGSFYGSVACRIPDPGSVVLRDREIPALEGGRQPEQDITYLVVRAIGASVPNLPPVDGHIVMAGEADLRAVDYAFASAGHAGLRAAMILGEPLGKLAAEITASIETRGSLDAPADFSGRYDYRFLDLDGNTIATLGARTLDGRVFDYRLPGGSGLNTMAYAGSGPVTSATGHLVGARGHFSVLGMGSMEPGAFAETAVINLIDPEGRLRLPMREGHRPGATPSALDRFLPMVGKLDENVERHRQWRWSFRKCAEVISTAVAKRYNELRNVGEFEGIEVDPNVLRTQFEAKIPPFNHEVFERYGGPARGQFRFYDQDTLQETGSNVLYSYWNPATFRFGTRYVKFITGSFQGYFRPDQIPDFSTHQFDPIVNSYREDVGVVSYILVFQNKPAGMFQERTSFAYKMPGAHEVMWLVKDLMIDGQPAPPDIFMTSHEWKDYVGNRARYLMAGMFWKIDFERATIALANNMFWRALYEEEPAHA